MILIVPIHIPKSVAQAPVHEAALSEAGPPLAGFASSVGVQFLDQTGCSLLSRLYKILLQGIYGGTWLTLAGCCAC